MKPVPQEALSNLGYRWTYFHKADQFDKEGKLIERGIPGSITILYRKFIPGGNQAYRAMATADDSPLNQINIELEDIVEVKIGFCSPLDNFSRAKGRTYALNAKGVDGLPQSLFMRYDELRAILNLNIPGFYSVARVMLINALDKDRCLSMEGKVVRAKMQQMIRESATAKFPDYDDIRIPRWFGEEATGMTEEELELKLKQFYTMKAKENTE